MRLLLTGGSGFIGSAFIRRALKNTNYHIRSVIRKTSDTRLTWRLFNYPHVNEAINNGRLELVNTDLLGDISGLCEGVDAVVHAAAKTFVDHSIRDPWPFVEANVVGTYRLLEDARKHNVKRFIQVSTDEVYGAILNGAYTEDSRLNPTNPYAASKAGSDCLAISYAHTFGMHTVVTRTENNYGPLQHPQKAFPTFVRYALKDTPLPIYGDGKHVRQWLWVDDHVDALLLLLTHKDVERGGVYHVAGSQELENLDLAKRILRHLCKPEDLIQLIPDHDIRPGHDRRYALSSDKIRKLGWEPKVNLDVGIQKATSWYANNEKWFG